MKRILALSLAAVLALSACGGNGTSSPSPTPTATAGSGTTDVPEGKPATWIADRTIKGKVFNGDVGLNLPADQINNEIAQLIKERTGISLEWEYTTGNNDLEVMITSIATGDIYDVLASYLNDSGRPEFPVLLKAAKEGMFADLAPYLADTEIYSKYLNQDYLPIDTYKNILFREDLGGKSYFMHMGIPRDPSVNYPNSIRYYINEDIAKQVGVEPKDIASTEQLMEVARKIKELGLKDENGNDIIPMGPTVWGGRTEIALYNAAAYSHGRESYFNVYNGEVKHITGTPFMLEQANIVREAIKEGLMDPEVFTMSNPRANESFLNGRFAMMVMGYGQAVDEFQRSGRKYLPITNIADAFGDTSIWSPKSEGYCVWAVSSKAENPGEILKFADYLATREGKMAWTYGIEGKHYDLDENGNPRLKKELFDLRDNNYQEAVNKNIGAIGSGWGSPLGATDNDPMADFGERFPGQSLNPEKAALEDELATYGDYKVTYFDGAPAISFLNEMPGDVPGTLRQFLEPTYYTDILVQAAFAADEAASKKIIDDYRSLLEKQGIIEFEQYLQGIYDETPEMIHFQ